jgi:hypothetical protein
MYVPDDWEREYGDHEVKTPLPCNPLPRRVRAWLRIRAIARRLRLEFGNFPHMGGYTW